MYSSEVSVYLTSHRSVAVHSGGVSRPYVKLVCELHTGGVSRPYDTLVSGCKRRNGGGGGGGGERENASIRHTDYVTLTCGCTQGGVNRPDVDHMSHWSVDVHSGGVSRPYVTLTCGCKHWRRH